MDWAWERLGIYIWESVEVRREGEECLGFPDETATSVALSWISSWKTNGRTDR